MFNNAVTQNSDCFSNDLETIKEILLATARRAEATDTRLDRLSENQSHAQEQHTEMGGIGNQGVVAGKLALKCS